MSSFLPVLALAKAGLAILAIMFISVFWGRWRFALIGFCLLFLVLGILRHEAAERQVINSRLQNYNQKEEAVSFTGIISDEPDVREDHAKLTINNIFFGKDEPERINGKVLLTADRYPEYRYGDKLKIKGRLQAPPIFDEFHYKDYLKKDGIYSVIYYPEIELLERENYGGRASGAYAKVLEFKDKLRGVVYRNFSPPHSSILGAMLLGDKSRISQEWKEKLNYAGVRHLTAISGMHIAILTVLLMIFLTGLGLWQRQAFYLTLALMIFFIAMTGFQPSSIRAGIMAGLFLSAKHLGRKSFSARTVVFAAAFMLAGNPFLLRLDIGFQLSFLAMMGIIYLTPIFRAKLKFLPEKGLFNFRSITAMTLSAQVFTLPILIYNFGYFSVVAPITNILIVSFLPFIMGLGFVFVLSGAVWSFLGLIFSLPLQLLLAYLVKIVEWFSGLPFSVYFLEVSWYWLIIIYLFLGIAVFSLQQRQKIKTSYFP